MIRVFLDQSRWIQLARVASGREASESTRAAFEILQEGVRLGIVSVPLASAHYVETLRRRDPDQRRRLGDFMWELSRGHTLADICTVAKWEMEVAVHEHLGGALPGTMPRIFGVGVSHAFAQDRLTVSPPILDELAPGVRHALQQAIDRAVERELIGGPPFELPAHGIARPDKGIAESWARARNERQARFLEWGVTSERAWRLALVVAYNDILEMLVPILGRSGMSMEVLVDGGPEAMTSFIEQLPTTYAMTCLEHAAIRNGASFTWEPNDFHDILMTSLASVYCDVVVGETKWVNLLRASRASRASVASKVTKDLADLPAVLATAA